ncbi:MAG: hypothetical protein OEY85_04665 [Rhodospirillales bacterium]|nr:hypothetical protein [Rhodospirillales bacterium]
MLVLLERVNGTELVIGAGLTLPGYGLYQKSVNPGGCLFRATTLNVGP